MRDIALFGQSPAPQGSAAYSFTNAEAETYVAAMSGEPDDTRKAAIDTYVGALKTAGIWSELDALYLLAAHDEQAARLNLKAPASFAAINVGAGPAFVANRGFTGNGTSTALNTQFTPSTNGVNFIQDDASTWLWSLTNAQSAAASCGAFGNRTDLVLRAATDQTFSRMNSANALANTAGNTLDSTGLFGNQRRAAGDVRIFRNGVQIASGTGASVGVNASAQWICGGNAGSFSAYQTAFYAAGSALTGLESALYDATLAYMQAVGAIP